MLLGCSLNAIATPHSATFIYTYRENINDCTPNNADYLEISFFGLGVGLQKY